MKQLSAVLVVAFGILLPLLISWHEGGWISVYTSPKYDFDMIPDLTGQVAVVTGSNTGRFRKYVLFFPDFYRNR